MRQFRILTCAALLAVAIAACGDSTTTGDQLIGTWALAAYDDHGTEGVTTGTWSFSSDATFAVLGSITFPDEPRDSLDVLGTWVEQGDAAVAMTVEGETTVWDVTFAPDTAVLTLPDQEGVVRITLTK
jgi:hypothetical protein